MIIRFRGKLGAGRAVLEPKDTLSTLVERICERFPEISAETLLLSESDANSSQIDWKEHNDSSLESLGIKHGDQIFLHFQLKSNIAGLSLQSTQEPVDEILMKKSGEIKRNLSKLCRHGSKGMCDYCRPLEPFSPEYKRENMIKHDSFHSYLRKIIAKTNKFENNSSFVPPLKQENYKVDRKCTNGHKTWPEGICSKCQPTAITLVRQEFRMLDHVEFANSAMIEKFLDYWRKTGKQRYAFMYGYYTPYEQVPLGIQAVVVALYEPQQDNESDGLVLSSELFPNNESSSKPNTLEKVKNFAKNLGLTCVGQIFTDLTDDGTGKGLVSYKRHYETYFVTGLELMLASHFQNQYPVHTTWSDTGKFGSRFVTCIISGNADKEVSMECYQVSNAGTAMVDADLMEPSLHPNFMYVKESKGSRYVPDIFYSKTNEYGKTIKQHANPVFPIDYLLVKLTHGFPKTSENDSMHVDSKASGSEHSNIASFYNVFPIANREKIGEVQDLAAIHKLWKNDYENPIILDFHFLLFIYNLGILSDEDAKVVERFVRGKDSIVKSTIMELDSFKNLVQITQSSFS